MSRTPVYKRFVYGASFPPREVYKCIKVGVLLISGSEVWSNAVLVFYETLTLMIFRTK